MVVGDKRTHRTTGREEFHQQVDEYRRVGDGCRLAIDCVVRDQHGAPYLRYRNHKMRRDALVPLDDRLTATIAEQQQATQARFPATGHLLVREKRNPDGRLHYSADTSATG